MLKTDICSCWVERSDVSQDRRSEVHLNWLTRSKLKENKEPVKKHAVVQLLSLQ